jgi:putative acetyltransferase
VSFDIRYSEMDDLAFLERVFADPKACDDFPFGPLEKDEALKNWVGFSRFKASLTGTKEGVPCAIGTLFLMPYRKVAHQASFYLIVDPKCRREGIGTSMVRNLAHLAKTRFRLECLNVEFYPPSHLEPLLKKLNFNEVYDQENFVQPGRPRVVMEQWL